MGWKIYFGSTNDRIDINSIDHGLSVEALCLSKSVRDPLAMIYVDTRVLLLLSAHDLLSPRLTSSNTI